MNELQIQLKAQIVKEFLDTFAVLDDIFIKFNITKDDGIVIRNSIMQDFINAI